MTLPPVVRIFFAIDLPPATKESLGSFMGALKRKSKSKAIRWTKPENLHITLHFLPEVKREHLTALTENVRAEIKGTLPSKLELGSLHLFPNPYRPRVIVLEVTPQEQLVALAEKVGQGIKTSHYEIETRPFRGHLTLGRIKQPKGVNLSFLAEFNEVLQKENIEIDEVILFRSEPESTGSKYTVLEKMTLGTETATKAL